MCAGCGEEAPGIGARDGEGCSVVVGEPCSRPARVSRGSVTMSEITHTASSPESGSWVETIPPVERAAAMSEAALPPDDFSRKRAWGSAPSGDDGAADYTTFGPNNPDWLEAEPQGTHGRDYPQGLDAAAWAATSPVGSRLAYTGLYWLILFGLYWLILLCHCLCIRTGIGR